MIMVALLSCLQVAVEAIHRAIRLLVRLAFKLDGSMTDMILLAQYGVQGVQNG